MITADYCLTMARYNAWQNKLMSAELKALAPDELTKDRGAFFGSIRNTANHILWGDQLWMSRLAGDAGPRVDAAQHTELTPTLAAWGAERFRTDGRILQWAGGLKAVDLVGELSWYSPMAGKDMKQPITSCIMHLFTHQTHHRGQVHAMITATGSQAWVTDLLLMPADGPWL
ncbi:DinB family protein [Thalassobius sp. S69A]|uniref:DinB family protein n=1 Tax=unclassified Thalassovita TaxID=2619711 RepID=UPI000C4FEFE1|nr:damage-inducible protein DinB [Paracoccaceae bacterium]